MIQLEQLTKRYRETTAVSELSLTVEAGELLVLLGGSGCGKTTTLKMINRLITPTSGTVRLAGTDVSTLEPHALRRRIGYVFQKVGFFPHMTVAENVAITPSLIGWESNRIRRRVDELLELVELEPSAVRDRQPTDDIRTMDPALMYQAAAEGAVDVISAFSTDGRLIALDLRVLEDDRHAIPPYDAVVLASPRLAANAPDVLAAVGLLDGAIDADTIWRMNLAVDADGQSPATVAESFLSTLQR